MAGTNDGGLFCLRLSGLPATAHSHYRPFYGLKIVNDMPVGVAF